MQLDNAGRRSFLKTIGTAGVLSALPEAAFGLHAGVESVRHEVAAPGVDADAKPEHSIQFAVIGLDHAHILGITAAVIRGGGELVAFYSTLPKPLLIFRNFIQMPNLPGVRKRF
jgi:hypothetical protein